MDNIDKKFMNPAYEQEPFGREKITTDEELKEAKEIAGFTDHKSVLSRAMEFSAETGDKKLFEAAKKEYQELLDEELNQALSRKDYISVKEISESLIELSGKNLGEKTSEDKGVDNSSDLPKPDGVTNKYKEDGYSGQESDYFDKIKRKNRLKLESLPEEQRAAVEDTIRLLEPKIGPAIHYYDLTKLTAEEREQLVDEVNGEMRIEKLIDFIYQMSRGNKNWRGADGVAGFKTTGLEPIIAEYEKGTYITNKRKEKNAVEKVVPMIESFFHKEIEKANGRFRTFAAKPTRETFSMELFLMKKVAPRLLEQEIKMIIEKIDESVNFFSRIEESLKQKAPEKIISIKKCVDKLLDLKRSFLKYKNMTPAQEGFAARLIEDLQKKISEANF